MHDRIRELVKQAGGHFSTHNLMSNPIQHRESIELWDKNIEKFAELIVQECTTVIEKNLFQNIGYNTSRAVKRHFGMEDEE